VENKKVLIYDGNWFAFRTFVTHRLCTSDGKDTTIIYGLLQDWGLMFKKFDIDFPIICWDGKKASEKKRRIYPKYKEHRKGRVDIDWGSYFYSISVCKEFLKKVKIPSLEFEDLEGDEVIAEIVYKLKKDNFCFIRATDKDMIQLLDKNVSIIKDIDKIITHDFFKENNINKKAWIFERALIGDSSDNIKGIRGIGEKRARSILQRIMGEKNYFKFFENKEYNKTKWRDKALFDLIRENLDLVRTNIRLMYLRPKGIKIKISEPSIDSKIWNEIMKEYEIRKFNVSEGFKQFKDIFKEGLDGKGKEKEKEKISRN